MKDARTKKKGQTRVYFYALTGTSRKLGRRRRGAVHLADDALLAGRVHDGHHHRPPCTLVLVAVVVVGVPAVRAAAEHAARYAGPEQQQQGQLARLLQQVAHDQVAYGASQPPGQHHAGHAHPADARGEDVNDHAVDADAARLGQGGEEDGHDDNLHGGGRVQQGEARQPCQQVAPGGQRAPADVPRDERRDEVEHHARPVHRGGVQEGGRVDHRSIAAAHARVSL